MRFDFNEWDKDKYREYINYLLSLEDIKYRDFSLGLVLNSKYKMIGIRIPILRGIAKEISKTDIKSFLRYVGDYYFEEIFIYGLVLSKIKDKKLFMKYFNDYINKIDNWSLCDSFCLSLKYDDEMFSLAINLSLDKKEFIARVGLIMLLDGFVKKEYIKEICNLLDKIDSDKYYVNMAMAWLLCEMFIKYRDDTLEYIKNNNLNKFTINKAISKINDSYRVSNEDKEMLKKYRKK